MTIHGSDPLHTDEALFVLGQTLVELQRRNRDDLQTAMSDGVLERPVLGAVLCVRALLEAFPDYGFHCHSKDLQNWRDLYLTWFDQKSESFPLGAKARMKMRGNAIAEFERILVHTEATGYRWGDD